MPDIRPPASAVVEGATTKADRIRALDRAGYSRSEIAGIVGVRYQHVRNVLVDDERLGRPEHAPQPSPCGLADAGRTFEGASQTAKRVVIGKAGTVRIPQAMLDAAGARPGDALLVRFCDGEIRLYTPQTAGRRLQALARELVPAGVNLADELIAERRKEAKRERGDG